MKHIFLIGFMGSGKTTTAVKLSKTLQTSYIDTDKLIEELRGKTIPSIFAEEGESAFRNYESETLHMIENKLIVSTGGGIVEREENIQFMQDNGVIIYLKTSLDVITNRLEQDKSRPLWKDEERNTRLYRKRQALYESCADLTVHCDGLSVDSITNEILSFVRYKGILRGE
ncbi:shikimate kinase [Ornithinibacillus scapharcae]|uniref:shikimate kinase n=1 Tax=Ornithinibacillus scapharcae TaxID=1147159 RepID=UPI000225B0EE|nr:shikimate kinase [Ornithinibacillus scapharcae]